MNKLFTCLLGSAAVILSAALPVRAEVVENYFYDFTKPIDGSDPAFAVASGWGHVVESYTYNGTTYYQSYSINAYSGKTKGALNIGNEEVGSTWSKKKVNDIIVTPKVSGVVSLWMKSSAYSGGGSARFYAMKKLADGSFEQGDEIADKALFRLTTGWEQVTFDPIAEDAEYPYIGIHASTAYLSDFSAEKADIEKTHRLSITYISTNATSAGLVCDQENNANVKLTVYLSNIGDYSYEDGAENLTLSVFMPGREEAVKVAPIGAIAEGESKNVECQLDPIPFSEIGSSAVFTVTENISGTSKQTSAITIKEYKPKVTFRESTYSDVPADYVLNFGKINSAVSKAMYLSAQSGTAPATITAIECPAGFSTSVTELPMTLQTTGRTDITISFDPEGLEPGVHAGAIVLTVENGDPATLPVSVDLIDPSLIYIPFADDKELPGEITNLNSSNLWKLDYTGYGSSRNNYIKPTSSYSEAALVLPKLTFSADRKLSVDARYDSRTSTCALKFAYSPDRTNWTELPDMTLTPYTDVPLTSDFQTFEVSGVPAGDFYLRISGREVYLDNIYGLPYAAVAHDLELTDILMPSAGMVNNRYEASVTLKNYKRDAEEADSYNVVLIVGENEFAASEAPEIAGAQGTATVGAGFTPHAVGEVSARMEVRFEDETVFATPEITLTIEEERVDAAKVIVPEKNGSTGNGYVLPISNSAGAASEQIYPASYINLSAGTKINGIQFMGCCPNADYTTHIEAWVALSERTTQNTDKTPILATDEMTKVYDGDYTFVKGGYTDSWILNLPFTEEFVYDGTSSLVVFLRAVNADGEKASNIQFANYNDGTSDKWNRYRRWFLADDGSLDMSKTDNWNLGYAALNLVVETGIVSGRVMEGELPVAGAKVTLIGDEVEYYGTSGDDGAYSVNVLQTGREYTATAEAEAYSTSENMVSFAESMSPALDIAMLSTKADLFQGVYEAVVLPDVSAAPAGTYYRFEAVEGNKLVFRDVPSHSELQANVPYIVLPDGDCSADLSSLTFDHVAQGVTVAGTTFQGVYASRVLRAGELLPTDLITSGENVAAAVADDAAKVARAAGAYVTTDILNPVISLRSSVSGIENVDADAAGNASAVYTVDGRLVRRDGSVDGLPAGIYIVNGQKVAIR